MIFNFSLPVLQKPQFWSLEWNVLRGFGWYVVGQIPDISVS